MIHKDDKGGSHFSMNPQVGKAKFTPVGGSPKDKGKGSEMASEHESGSSTSLHSHGDGSFHTEGGAGERTEHPSLGHALMHMAHQHAPEGKHVHVHSSGGMHSMHTVDDNGDNQGPHDHGNLEELKSSMDQFLGEEGQEGSSGYGSENNSDSGGSDSSHLME